MNVEHSTITFSQLDKKEAVQMHIVLSVSLTLKKKENCNLKKSEALNCFTRMWRDLLIWIPVC